VAFLKTWIFGTECDFQQIKEEVHRWDNFQRQVEPLGNSMKRQMVETRTNDTRPTLIDPVGKASILSWFLRVGRGACDYDDLETCKAAVDPEASNEGCLPKDTALKDK